MKELTIEGKKWLDAVQNVLDECPSERIIFYTTGKCYLYLYHLTMKDDIDTLLDNRFSSANDMYTAVQKTKAEFDEILTFSVQIF